MLVAAACTEVEQHGQQVSIIYTAVAVHIARTWSEDGLAVQFDAAPLGDAALRVALIDAINLQVAAQLEVA
jgi:hypothetical protein